MIDPRVDGNLKQLKGKIKERWGELTDDDLEVFEGRREQLVGKIQERYGAARAEVESQVDRFFDRVSGLVDDSSSE